MKIKKESVIVKNTVIVCQLKIFHYDTIGGSKKINYNMSDLLKDNKVTINNTKFNIKCVIFHLGDSVNSGHYISLIRNTNNSWTEVNDDQVISNCVSINNIGQPYLIFLEKDHH